MEDPEALAENWVEHTHTDGRVYFYNKVTSKSLWEKPEALKSPEERTGASTRWKEYKTTDGRPYYYNVFTQKTTWEVPDEIAALRSRGQDEGAKTPVYETQEDKKQAFFQMLTDKEVSVKMKWEDVMKIIHDDKRFNIFPSGGEKRQLFGEFLNHKQREERETLRRKRLRAKDDFLGLLRSNIHDTFEIKENTKFRDVYCELSVHECWEYIDGDKERDELFQEFMDEWERLDREKKRVERKKTIDSVKTRLEEDVDSLKPDIRWRDLVTKYKDDSAFSALKKHDACQVWDELPKELAIKALNRKRKDKYRAERKARGEFRKLMEEFRKRGKIKLDTEWGDIAPCIEEHSSLFDLIGNAGSTPRDFFLETKDPLIDSFEDDKNKLRKMMRELNIDLNSKTSYDTFIGEFGSRVDDIHKTHLRLTYEYYIDKAAEREKLSREEDDRERRTQAKRDKDREEDERRDRRKRDKFIQLLEDIDIRATASYASVEEELGGFNTWKAISEGTRRELVKTHLASLEEKKRKRAPSDGSERKEKKEKRATSDGSERKEKEKKEKKKEKKEKKKNDEDKKRRKHSSSPERSKKRRKSQSSESKKK